MPFSKAALVVGAPIDVPEQMSEEEFEAIRLQAEAALDRVEAEAEGAVGHPAVPDLTNKGVTR
jgi:hypothetical protein